MGDESTNTDANEETQATDHANTGGAGNSETGGDGGFKAITSETELTAWKEATRKQMLAEARKAAETDAKRNADETAAREKGEWEKVAKAREEEAESLKAQLAARDAADLKRKVAAKHKLPADLANRLVGDDEAALDADAKILAKSVGQRDAPDTEGGAGGAHTSGTSDRPLPPRTPKDGEMSPAWGFDGRPRVAIPRRS